MQFPFLAYSALLPFTFAHQDHASPSSSGVVGVATPTDQAPATIQTVTVGQGGLLKFDPDSLSVASGSSVVFQFYPGGHSVVQGSFDEPCSPSSGLAFYSGVVDSSSGPAPQLYTFPVDNIDPIWIYCGTPSHCQSGMVAVINPTVNQTLDMYRSGAANSSGTRLPRTTQGGVLSSPTTTPAPKSETGKPVPSIVGVTSLFLAFLLAWQT